MHKSNWAPRIGWTLVLLIFVAFIWGMNRRGRLEATGDEVIRMLFVPSVEQGTLVQRGDELARFVREDSGLILRSEVPTSYAAVIQALGTRQADVAWMPVFAYDIAHARYGAEAKLQVVRSVERRAVLIARTTPGEARSMADLAGKTVVFPETLPGALRQMLKDGLDREAPGWIELAADDDKAAVRLMIENPSDVAAAASSFVESGPFDLVGDGRKELEYDRPGTMETTAIIFTTEESVSERASVYYGCVYSRTDSGVRRLEDFNGRSFAFSDETSVSGHIFPRMLLGRHDVSLGRVYYAGGHPNVVQAVWDGKAMGGSAFYSPPSAQQLAEGFYVGDARYLLLKRMDTDERRRQFLEDLRVVKLTDAIPNDLCAVRQGFPEAIWQRFLESFDRFLETPQGKEAFADILAGVAVTRVDDSVLNGFRAALEAAGMSADTLLQAEEKKLEGKRKAEEGSS